MHMRSTDVLLCCLSAATALRLPPQVRAPPSIICVGECLFDGLPAGIFLGGAPLNVAVHAAQLGARTSFVSAVGDDRLGAEAVRRLTSSGVDTSLVATVPAETGFVTVALDAAGDASYEFATPAAWDGIPADGVANAAAAADAVVYGTLAMRMPSSRATVLAARDASRFAVCDINLRPPYDAAEVVAEAAFGVGLLKLSDEELAPVAEALQARHAAATDALALREAADAAVAKAGQADGAVGVAAAAAALGHAARASCVVVTRGASGAVCWERGDAWGAPGEAWSCGGFAVAAADTVGAGDAFLAALLRQRLDGASAEEALVAGCRLGAYVAACQGATPRHDGDAIAALAPAGPSSVCLSAALRSLQPSGQGSREAGAAGVACVGEPSIDPSIAAAAKSGDSEWANEA